MLYVFKIIGKKIKCSLKKEGASSSLRKENAAENFGNTMICPNYCPARGALSPNIVGN